MANKIKLGLISLLAAASIVLNSGCSYTTRARQEKEPIKQEPNTTFIARFGNLEEQYLFSKISSYAYLRTLDGEVVTPVEIFPYSARKLTENIHWLNGLPPSPSVAQQEIYFVKPKEPIMLKANFKKKDESKPKTLENIIIPQFAINPDDSIQDTYPSLPSISLNNIIGGIYNSKKIIIVYPFYGVDKDDKLVVTGSQYIETPLLRAKQKQPQTQESKEPFLDGLQMEKLREMILEKK